jgi:hypothetical protein
MKTTPTRIWLFGALAAIVAGGALAIAWRDARPGPTDRHAALAARPAPWEDRANRTDPPGDGYLPAWKLRPPRPRGEPAPAVVPPSSPSLPGVADAARAADGDRPARPIPGLR